MEYTPRYPQPFTLAEAVGLDVSTITEEIARLQNSLARLRATQAQLKEALAEAPDPDFSKAVEENEVTIGSQDERVSILRLALAEKGVPLDGHFALEPSTAAPPPANAPAATPRATQSLSRQPAGSAAPRVPPGLEDVEMDEDGGVHL
ncbi:hypothetical protein PsYK624_002960 [Phanerochaete sordida]|uniref:Uncharacterized protein n=1 Tax=Phanerochaete sordida TaxID=48140 RepID=A0A9P3L6U1_9APHY|nr:hypothetical protein PsYK624_002960 [Phanerochaete sordida]